MTTTGAYLLLRWAQKQIVGYNGVALNDFHRSWQDGLAFCALIDKLAPKNGIEFKTLKGFTKADKKTNLELAFSTAEKLGVARLLESDDILANTKPDEIGIQTYVLEIYKKLYNGTDKEQLQQDFSTNSTPTTSTQNSSTTSTSADAARKKKEEQERKRKYDEEVKKRPKCSGCGEPLSGRSVQAGDLEFHEHCFKCSDCTKLLGDTFLNVGGKPYCEACGKATFVRMKKAGQSFSKPVAKPAADNKEKTSEEIEEEKKRLQALIAEKKAGQSFSKPVAKQAAKSSELESLRKQLEEEEKEFAQKVKRRLEEREKKKYKEIESKKTN